MMMHVALLYSWGCQTHSCPLPSMPFWMLKVLLLFLQAACESLEQFCPYKSPPWKSVNLIWPNGIVVYFEVLLLYVILISLFEHSTSKRYPAFANLSMKCGILRGSTGLFIFFTSIIWNNSVGSGRIKAIGKSRAKVTSNSNGGSILVRGWGPGKERGASSREIHYMTCFTMAQHIVLSQNYIIIRLNVRSCLISHRGGSHVFHIQTASWKLPSYLEYGYSWETHPKGKIRYL